jgi:hypothetical protein
MYWDGVVDKTWDMRRAFVNKLMNRIWIAYMPLKLEIVCWVNTSSFKVLEPECTSMILETEHLVYSRHFFLINLHLQSIQQNTSIK